MEIIYAQQPFPKKITKSIFLAGPTPREEKVESWRAEAIKYLKKIKYDGTIFVPEFEGGAMSDDKLNYSGQVEWESTAMNMADVIVFWIARNIEGGLPAFTTNDEYGHWKTSGKIVLGTPKDADKVKYQEYYAKKLNIPAFHDLDKTLDQAVKQLGEGALRKNGETKVPLQVWNHVAFKGWYADLKAAGNRLDDAKVEYTKRVGPKQEILFFIALWAKVYITKEKRYKENEIVFMRNNISSCVLYKIDDKDILNSDIVFVKEFRTPVSNKIGMVCEVPGGSSFKNVESAVQVIVDELKEETGTIISPDKLIFEGERQLQATTLSHKCFLFSYELNDKEVSEIKAKKGKTFGNIEDTEMTYVEIYKLKDILKSSDIDWANIGFLLSVITKKIHNLSGKETVEESTNLRYFIKTVLQNNI